MISIVLFWFNLTLLNFFRGIYTHTNKWLIFNLTRKSKKIVSNSMID